MKSAIMRFAFGAAFGLIVVAVGISITTEQARAESCSGTTIGHRNSACLTAAYSNNRQTLSLTNECSSLGVVTAEVKTHNNGPEGLVTGLIELSNSTPWVYTILREHGIYTNARCCTTSGVCAITDCDTTNGVIDDSSHKTHCSDIDNTTGAVITAGNEITNGVVTHTPPSSEER